MELKSPQITHDSDGCGALSLILSQNSFFKKPTVGTINRGTNLNDSSRLISEF